MCQSIMFKDVEIDLVPDLAALVGRSRLIWEGYVLEEDRDTTANRCLCSINIGRTLFNAGVMAMLGSDFICWEVDMTLEEAKSAIARIPPEDKPAKN